MSFPQRSGLRYPVLWVAAASACTPASEPALEPGVSPLQILAAKLTHGVGEHPLDSELAWDSVNAAILVRARNGVPRPELAADVVDRDDRLAALVERGLLRETEDGFQTAFPILLGVEAREYRRLTTELAGTILVRLRPELDRLLTELERRGWSAWGYHFMWSQVFDSQFQWVEMVQRGLVPPLAPSIAWVVYPTHPFMSGTNLYPDDRLDTHFLAVTWTPQGREVIDVVGGNWRPIYRAALAGRPDTSDVRLLQRLGLIAADGSIAIPVVSRRDNLYGLLQDASHRFIELLREELALEDLMEATGAGPEVSWAMAYHDIAWDVLRRLTEDGTIARPPVLGDLSGVAEVHPIGLDGFADVRGTSAVIEAYPPFHALIERALGGD